MKRTLVVGSACADLSLYIDHLPGIEEDIEPDYMCMSLGGCAANCANLLRILDVPFTLLAPIGTGIYGNFVKEKLAALHMESAIKSSEENGVCVCLVDKKGNRSFLSHHGTEYVFYPEYFSTIDGDIYDFIYISGFELEEKTGDTIVQFLEENPGKEIFFAIGPCYSAIPKDRIQRIWNLHPILHLNRKEACVILKNPSLSLEDCAKGIQEQTHNICIVTDGANGTAYTDGPHVLFEPAFPVEAVDGTGAGDAHIGTVIAMLQKGKSLSDAIRIANYVGAITTQSRSAMPDETTVRKLCMTYE